MATRLFGVIFCGEIGRRGPKIVQEYKQRKSQRVLFDGKDWPGSPHEAVIADGRKLAQFVDPHYTVVRKWRGA